jgi:hypothetical protein
LTSFDANGARISFEPIQRERRAGLRRIVTLGCSFTLGAEVRDQEAWAYLVDAARPTLEVANLGFGGYGLDQAYLAWERNGRPLQPDAIWIGLVPDAATRATTHFPPLRDHWNRVVAFKPLFRLDEKGALVFHPSPAHDARQSLDLLGNQADLIEMIGASDTWILRAPLAYAPRGSSWTHYSGFARLALTLHEARGRDPVLHLGDAESEVSRLLRTLIVRLRDEVRKYGCETRLLILPCRSDLQSVRAAGPEGKRYWQPFVDSIEAAGLRTLDPTAELLDAGALEDRDFWMPDWHYGPLGNRVVADAILSEWETEP